MNASRTRFVGGNDLAGFCAVVLFLFALCFSSFHVHEAATALDTCPVCRFERTTIRWTVMQISPARTPESHSRLIPLPDQKPIRVVFRFSSVCSHAPPLASAS